MLLFNFYSMLSGLNKCCYKATVSVSKKVERCCITLNMKLMTELRSVTCHVGFHSISCHSTQVNTPLTLIPARQTGTRFTCLRGMEGWVDLGFVYIPQWFTSPPSFTHPSSNRL